MVEFENKFETTLKFSVHFEERLAEFLIVEVTFQITLWTEWSGFFLDEWKQERLRDLIVKAHFLSKYFSCGICRPNKEPSIDFGALDELADFYVSLLESKHVDFDALTSFSGSLYFWS